MSSQSRRIPARAGTTQQGQSSRQPGRAHPRSRGEHIFFFSKGVTRFGSSPLARGTLGIGTLTHACLRLIPARAGNTATIAIASGSRSAHPRSRREHSAPGLISQVRRGSSPLARGTHDDASLGHAHARLIPARAGNTATRLLTTLSCPAHPRSRGEHASLRGSPQVSTGSSPLARGT